MTFGSIIGQEDVKLRLRQQVDEGRVPHAQLMAGKSGVGKLALALAYAQYLNCAHRHDGEPCGECPSCRQYAKLEHPDLHLVFPYVKKGKEDTCDDYLKRFRAWVLENPYGTLRDWLDEQGGDNKQGQIYANESDEMLSKLSLKGYSMGYKVMVIWMPEKMNVSCANKLLKTLEEPPSQTVLLLVSDDADSVLGTIQSRCQRIHVPPIEQDALEAWLKKQNPGLTDEHCRRLARTSGGSWREAQRMLQEESMMNDNLVDFMFLMRTAWGIRHYKTLDKKGDALIALRKWSEGMNKRGRDSVGGFLDYCQRLVRENFVYNFHNPRLNYMSAGEEQFAQKFAPYINENNVIGMMKCLDDAKRDIGQNTQIKLVMTDMALQMIMLMK